MADQIPPNLYHLHLDLCKRCRENPMDQCPVGLATLRATATGDTNVLTMFDTVVPERASVFDLMGELEGHSPEEIAAMKDIAAKVLGPWVLLL